MHEHIVFGCLSIWHKGKPYQSVYLEFVKRCDAAILKWGEFEALRRWLLSSPDCLPIQITGETSHRCAHRFLKELRREKKTTKLSS